MWSPISLLKPNIFQINQILKSKKNKATHIIQIQKGGVLNIKTKIETREENIAKFNL